jgi:hypothetical protein
LKKTIALFVLITLSAHGQSSAQTTADQISAILRNLDEQVQQILTLEKKAELLEIGIDPFPQDGVPGPHVIIHALNPALSDPPGRRSKQPLAWPNPPIPPKH